jgi:hypothetical protein
VEMNDAKNSILNVFGFAVVFIVPQFDRKSGTFDSAHYWKNRYKSGGNSGSGSYGELAEFKANSFNNFIEGNGIYSCIEYGCGDGNQLSLMRIDNYLGLDVSPEVILATSGKFSADLSKSFEVYDPDRFNVSPKYRAEMSISMDVILHLIEDERYELYMRNLFDSGSQFVGIFNTATDQQPARMAAHNKFRNHTKWVSTKASEFQLAHVDLTPIELEYPENTGFYYYQKH